MKWLRSGSPLPRFGWDRAKNSGFKRLRPALVGLQATMYNIYPKLGMGRSHWARVVIRGGCAIANEGPADHRMRVVSAIGERACRPLVEGVGRQWRAHKPRENMTDGGRRRLRRMEKKEQKEKGNIVLFLSLSCEAVLPNGPIKQLQLYWYN